MQFEQYLLLRCTVQGNPLVGKGSKWHAKGDADANGQLSYPEKFLDKAADTGIVYPIAKHSFVIWNW
jgi:hypothetical protein